MDSSGSESGVAVGKHDSENTGIIVVRFGNYLTPTPMISQFFFLFLLSFFDSGVRIATTLIAVKHFGF